MKELFEKIRLKVKGLKTVIVAAGIATVGVLQQANWLDLVNPSNAGWILLGLGVVMALLRCATNTGVGRA